MRQQGTERKTGPYKRLSEECANLFSDERHIKDRVDMGEKKKTAWNRNREGHRRRLREKFIRSGLQGFLDYEVIELLLTLGTPRKDCKNQAKEALMRFKTLRGVLEADSRELQAINGLGPQNVFGIKLIHHVSRRFLRDKMMDRPVCHSSQEVFDYLYHSIRDSMKEMFKVLFLDAKNNVIEEKTIFAGTVDSSAVYPREIIRLALKNNASSLIFVHNHPSGDPDPSESDKDITKELVFAANIMQLKVLDHIIIGNNCYFSFADKGYIDEYEHLYLDMRKESHIHF